MRYHAAEVVNPSSPLPTTYTSDMPVIQCTAICMCMRACVYFSLLQVHNAVAVVAILQKKTHVYTWVCALAHSPLRMRVHVLAWRAYVLTWACVCAEGGVFFLGGGGAHLEVEVGQEGEESGVSCPQLLFCLTTEATGDVCGHVRFAKCQRSASDTYSGFSAAKERGNPS